MNQLKTIRGYVLSFELLFLAFLMAGTYKSAPCFEKVPFDLTIFFMVLSILVAAKIIIGKLQNNIQNEQILGSNTFIQTINIFFNKLGISRVTLIACVIYFAFFVWALLSMIYSPSSIYSLSKVLRFGLLTGWAFFGMSLIIATESERAKRFLGIFTIYALIMTVEALRIYISSGRGLGFVTAFGSNYIALGRIVGAASLIVFVRLLFSKKLINILFLVIAFSLMIITVCVSGSRGPLLAVAFALLVLLFISVFGKPSYWRRLIFIIILIFAMISVAYSQGLLDTTVLRFGKLLSETTTDANARLDLYNGALVVWSDNPIIGVGIGGFPVKYGFGDQRGYPHNIILEVLSELGLIGLLLLVLFFYTCFRTLPVLRYLNKHPVLLISVLLFSQTFFNAMISGDLNDNRLLFTFAGLLLAGKCYADTGEIDESDAVECDADN